MSTTYEKWLERYLMDWCTFENLERLVAMNQITDKELKKMVKIKEEQKEPTI